ncbi:MAG: sigma-70 family RNA polymerase sigma factor [Phycisphaerales bacterium]|nr:MAG: sigma-70 family RNA polymerase sigma factor [Phycisphaerales bacterium]
MSRLDRTEVAAPDAGDAGLEIDVLLTRMRAGDREAAAQFIQVYGSRVRRRVRGKLGRPMRRLFDSQEILSTVSRRLDDYVRGGKLEAVREEQLWALVFRMAENALVDKSRIFQRLQRVEDCDGPFARDMLRRLEDAEAQQSDGAQIEVDQALRCLDDLTDRQILTLWLNGDSHNAIAQHVGIAPTAVRKRWQKIKGRLRDEFLGETEQSCPAG